MKFFEHHPWAAILAILLLYGFVGSMDYADARQAECAAANLSYNKEQDKCQ